MTLPATISLTAVKRSIELAIEFLQDRQKPWGEFASCRFDNPALQGAGHFDSSPFTTTFVLHALSFVDHAAAIEMRQSAKGFLLAECEQPGLWRYWASRQNVVIDPDLDDTCCASFALWGAQRNPGKEALNLDCILKNRHETGFFKTWLRGAEKNNDVDGTVNANVLLYLGERSETIPARNILIEAINHDRERQATWYYPDPLAFYYAVSRAFFHGVCGFSQCRNAVLRKIHNGFASGDRTPLSVALALCTLLNYGERDTRFFEELFEWLLKAQSSDGCWERSAFYTGPEPPEPHQVWWGSEELTTAFCIEAVARSK